MTGNIILTGLKIRLPYKTNFKKFLYAYSYTDFAVYRDYFLPVGLHLIYRYWNNRTFKVYKSLLLKVLTTNLIKRFFVYPVDGNCAYSATGEEFIEFTSCGIFDGKLKKHYKTSLGAILAYKKLLKNYLKDKEGIFFWRIKPELGGKFLTYTVYSRFLISEEPIKEIKLSF